MYIEQEAGNFINYAAGGCKEEQVVAFLEAYSGYLEKIGLIGEPDGSEDRENIPVVEADDATAYICEATGMSKEMVDDMQFGELIYNIDMGFMGVDPDDETGIEEPKWLDAVRIQCAIDIATLIDEDVAKAEGWDIAERCLYWLRRVGKPLV